MEQDAYTKFSNKVVYKQDGTIKYDYGIRTVRLLPNGRLKVNIVLPYIII